MTALPGTPAIQNAIPMPFFGTTAFAAPGLGILASIIMFTLGLVWLNRRAASARALVKAMVSTTTRRPSQTSSSANKRKGVDLTSSNCHQRRGVRRRRDLPPFWLAILPILVVIVSNFVFIEFIIPRVDTSFLEEPRFGATSIESVRGVWAVIVGLTLAIVLLIVSNWRRLVDLRASLDQGADASVLPIFNTASLVGFGAVIAACQCLIW